MLTLPEEVQSESQEEEPNHLICVCTLWLAFCGEKLDGEIIDREWEDGDSVCVLCEVVVLALMHCPRCGMRSDE